MIYAPKDFLEKEAVDFAYQRGIGVIAIHVDSVQELFLHEPYDRDIKVYMQTCSVPEDEKYFRMKGF